MNETMINNWNSRVQKDDIVYHLGDFGFTRGQGIDPYQGMKNLLGRLNGQINLVLGNHDCQNYNQKVLSLFASNSLLREKSIGRQRIIMCHYAMITWAGKARGAWMLCGHSHYNLPVIRKDATEIGKILDIGVDGNNFMPYSFDEIKQIMDKKPTLPSNHLLNDHHKGNEEI